MNTDCLKTFRAVVLGLLLSLFDAHAAPTNDLPKLDDVLKLLREHGALSQAELDRAATKGVLKSLRGQIVLVTNSVQTNLATVPALTRSTNFDNGFAYFRVGQVKEDLSEQIDTKFRAMSAGGKIKGVVLDLRYATGTNFSAAGAAANLFVSEMQPLLSWGKETVQATAKTNGINVPVVVLINQQTGGAAEALAAVLHDAQVALLIGAPSEGSASIFNDFSLPNGQQVRMAVAQVKTGKNKTVPPEGLKPDIQVDVTPEDEKSYFEDPYKVMVKPGADPASTNSVANARTNQPRLNEAELVRQHKEGFNMRDQVADQPFKNLDLRAVSDPALIRAIDLLKGLAVLQQTRR